MNDLLRQKLEILIQEVTELSEDLMPTGTTPIDMYAAGFSLGMKLPVVVLKRLLKENPSPSDESNPH